MYLTMVCKVEFIGKLHIQKKNIIFPNFLLSPFPKSYAIFNICERLGAVHTPKWICAYVMLFEIPDYSSFAFFLLRNTSCCTTPRKVLRLRSRLSSIFRHTNDTPRRTNISSHFTINRNQINFSRAT